MAIDTTQPISLDDIAASLRAQIDSFASSVSAVDVGTVTEVGDGIARVNGLPNVQASELVEFTKTGILGMVLNLEQDSIGVVIMGDFTQIGEGDAVTSTGRIISVPVGEGLIGRVVDPLGRPLDGKGPIKTDKYRPLERIAPGVVQRQNVDTPVQTGVTAIDALIPIGRGQRELIIGDRSTGKTAVTLDTIINQKGKKMVCVVCGHWPKAGANCPRGRHAGKIWGDGIHGDRGRLRFRERRAAIHCPLRRGSHRRRDYGERRGDWQRVYKRRAGCLR